MSAAIERGLSFERSETTPLTLVKGDLSVAETTSLRSVSAVEVEFEVIPYDPAVKEQLLRKFDPLNVNESITGTTFIDPDTGRTARDTRGALIFQTVQNKDGVIAPVFTPLEKSTGTPIGREKNGSIIFKSVKTRNY